MPVLPMVGLALAPHLESLVAARWLRLTAFALALAGGAVIIGAGAWALLGHSEQADAFVQRRDLGDLGRSVWIMVIVIGAAFVASALAFRPRRGVAALLGGLAVLWLVWSFWSYPLLNDSSSARGVMQRARALAGPDAEIGLVGWKEQNLLMLSGPTRDFGFLAPRDRQYLDAVRWQSQAPERRWIFIIAPAMGDCVDRSSAVRIGEANRREWWMFQADAVRADCVPAAGEDDDTVDAAGT
jgi:hypothetical protein